ncbi:MAG: hypothetical protein AB7S56_01075 [Halothiobacillaceae bacterium]
MLAVFADGVDLDVPPLLMPPWRKLQKLGKSAMDGAFSPFATWMSRRGDPVFADCATACPKGGINGVHFFGDFLCASKESYSPVSIMLFAKLHPQNGRNNATVLERVVGFFARLNAALCTQSD